MKKSDITLLASIALVVAIVSFFVARAVFNPPSKHTKVPVVEPISSSFPDVKNDPAYQLFLYSGALDPTQPIQIGNSKNAAPFNSQ